MKIMIVGNGAREHALSWKLAQSPLATEILVAPGNAGTLIKARNVDIDMADIESLFNFATAESVDLTVVGPELPLVNGLVDLFKKNGLAVFGPTKSAARIEASKSFAKNLMVKCGVPTGKAESFDNYHDAVGYVKSIGAPIVIKADGLAAGKGVIVCHTVEEATRALYGHMIIKNFGDAGERILVEEYLEGQEISAIGFTDGENVTPLAAACDYKRVGDGDTGSNTGGMGAYSPPDKLLWNEDVEIHVRATIVQPIISALAESGSPYRGAIYAGLIITADGPKVIEFNCRLGDPETQVILPRLKTDLLDIMLNAASGSLRGYNLEWDSRSCVGVVLASGGYPENYQTGFTITGLGVLDPAIEVFHAGTTTVDNHAIVRTNGGRVLTITALGPNICDARQIAYDNIGRVTFENSFHRNDIADLETNPTNDSDSLIHNE